MDHNIENMTKCNVCGKVFRESENATNKKKHLETHDRPKTTKRKLAGKASLDFYFKKKTCVEETAAVSTSADSADSNPKGKESSNNGE